MQSSDMFDLIRKGTKSSNEMVPVDVCRSIKRMCKESPADLVCAAHFLMDRMRMTHSRTRLLALSVINMLFQRSERFRRLIIKELPELLDLTLGLHTALPLPHRESDLLKQHALYMLACWAERFGGKNKRLQLASYYLTSTMGLTVPQGEGLMEMHKKGMGKRSMTQTEQKKRRSKRKKLNAIKRGHLITKGRKVNPNSFIALPNTFST